MREIIIINNVELKFSNSSEGFDISAYNFQTDNSVFIHLRPWGRLGDFVSAVLDFSYANGLCEVSDQDLGRMLSSLRGAEEAIIKEQNSRKDDKQ